MYAALLFDLDGVLINSERTTYEIWRSYLLEHEDYDLPEKVYSQISGSPAVSFGSLMDGLIPGDKNLLLSNWLGRMDAFAFSGRIPLKPGYEKLQVFLEGYGGKKAIVTSNGSQWLPAYLDKLQSEKYFDAVITGKMVKRLKPEPDLYLFACKKLQVEPENCLAVEDSVSGVQAALTAGIPVMRMMDFPGFPEELDKRCVARVRDLNEAVSFFSGR